MSAVDELLRVFPTLPIKRVSGDEFAGPCPWCGGRDRFHVWDDKGNYWCRPGPGHCGAQGFVDALTGSNNWGKLDDHERRLLEVERKQAEHERILEEHERRLTAIDKMRAIGPAAVESYYNAMLQNDDAIRYWLSEGMTTATIKKYQLGYCHRCPTDHEGRASATIPVFSHPPSMGGALACNGIRHRLFGATNGDKYRPHLPGLPQMLFNADHLRSDDKEIVIVEGEKKSIIADQIGILTVGVMGKTGFKPTWARLFDGFARVSVCYDPDATESAAEVAALFGRRGRVVVVPMKLDDLVVRAGATTSDVLRFIRMGRPV